MGASDCVSFLWSTSADARENDKDGVADVLVRALCHAQAERMGVCSLYAACIELEIGANAVRSERTFSSFRRKAASI